MPRTTLRAAGAALLAGTLCATLAGCSGSSAADEGGRVTLRFTWWGNPDRAERTEEAVAAFEKRHPRIDVQTSYTSFEAYKQKLATQAAGGDVPDVVQLDYRQISQYAGSGVLLDLDEQQRALPTDEMDRTLVRTGKYEGTQYALPMGLGTQVLAYDAKVWRKAGAEPPKPGWTWDDLLTALRKVARVHEGPVFTDIAWNEDWFELWLRGHGKSLYKGHGELGFTAADLARFWEFSSKLRRAGLTSPARETTQIDGAVENTPLGRNKTVAEFNWDAPSAGYEEIVGDGLRLGPFPSVHKGEADQYFKPSMLVGIAANSAHPREAAQFIDFLLNSGRAADILGVDRGLPVNERQRARVLPKLSGFERTLAKANESVAGLVKPPPAAPPRGDIALQSTFGRDYDHVAFEKASARQVAEDYITEVKSELRDQ